MDNFEELSLKDIKEVVDELYNDNEYSFICAGAKTFKYKNQYVKISVANDEEDL